LFGVRSFAGGVHPPHSKHATEHLAIEPLAAPAKVVIPLSQHIGAPARAVVKAGDEVRVGQLLGEPGGFVSAPVHCSVAGKVLSVVPFAHPLGRQVMAVEVENNGTDEAVEMTPPVAEWRTADAKALMAAVQAAGVVGMGGASFPTHVKLSPPEGKTIDTLIINGAECEPYLTADHRLLLERTAEVLEGALILKRILGAQHLYLAIEVNKPDAVSAMSKAVHEQGKHEAHVVRLRTKYPQGGEKQLINAVTGRQVPTGGLPMDCGCVVQNVGTALAVREAVVSGKPLYERVVTVTGPTVAQPRNFLVRIGTPLRALLEACKVDMGRTCKVVMGGPMMGLAQQELDAPVIKSTSGLLALDRTTPAEREYDCIWCGNCHRVCPIHLIPSLFARASSRQRYEDAEKWGVMDCMECGSCAFACPASINLVHHIKLDKFHVQALRAARKK
jgi:Na+-translocating ferredoxin:NAD+ oxidoreductase subunit C